MHEFFGAHPVARWALVALLVAGALLALIRVFTPDRNETAGTYRDDTETELGHVAMLGAMAAMVAFLELDMAVWRWVFGVLAAGYGLLLVMRFHADVNAAAGAGYHTVASLAMLYTTTESHHHHGGGLPYPWLGWALSALFVIDAIGTAIIAPRELRVAVVPHLVMDVGMTLMLVAAL